MDPLLKIKVSGVYKGYNKQNVLNNISIDICAGEIFGLLGPSGAGKTTLVKMVAGIEVADRGSITVLDVAMPNLSLLEQIGFMAQSDALYGDLTALENINFFASLYGLKGSERKRRIAEVMQLVNLSQDFKKPIQQFSGGMKRRLSLAIALLHHPKILILDEPTVGIDPVLREAIWKELRSLSANGTTILLTTHVMDEAEKCDRLAMVRKGSIIATGSPAELKAQASVGSIEEVFIQLGGMNV